MTSFDIIVPVDSRYHKTDLLQVTKADNETFTWGVWGPIEFDEEEDDLIHRVRGVDVGRLDLLADQFYGNTNLWWVIATANGIMNQLTDMKSGDLLRIPERTAVLSRLLESDAQGTTAREIS